MSNEFEEAKGVDRRTIVKGAAWSLPVIVAAASAPLAAATTTPQGNLKAEAVDCNLISLNIAGSGAPGFRYLVTEGTVKAGTEIDVEAGGLANIDIGSWQVSDSTGGTSTSGTPSGISLLFLGGKTARIRLLRDYAVGEWIRVGITGINASIVGRYTTSILTPDSDLNDQNAGFTAGGVGLLNALGAFICFSDATQHVEPAVLPTVDVKVTPKCPTIIGGAPRFEIGVNGSGTIPAGTKFLLYSNAVANINFGEWRWSGGGSSGAANMIDLLGLGGSAKIVELPRNVTAGTPIELIAEGLGANVGVNARLAFIGSDVNSANNTAGVNFTGITVGGLFAGSCQTV
ncbi:hypothetical protein [Microbacterium sp. No. 7]|uniref:hypothetical protein n=1 Tax=Microbacterium sp. No. 7 TaxID=1714373 RepID=UPI0006D0A47A|nr:hypothetical protein [Microbacterium sp. No. 7]ALJ19100.1 hypothetical protein AOA12_03950 [Microbacterium sp. No. 7]